MASSIYFASVGFLEKTEQTVYSNNVCDDYFVKRDNQYFLVKPSEKVILYESDQETKYYSNYQTNLDSLNSI